MLVRLIPCAEMVRFGKNGSDVTAGAVRLARAYTGREHVASCGYHGWHDWCIGATARNRGVPQVTRDLTHSFTYNDLESLRNVFRSYPGQIAAVIIEPMHVCEPVLGYLESVKELTNGNGAVLIFDEMVTGFRFANGGAQEYFGVTPDLATFGKALANGHPLSALTGSAKIMSLMQDEVFFSVTYGGESLSLAAAMATLRKISELPIIHDMTQTGIQLKVGIQQRIDRHEATDIASVSGHPTWTCISFANVDGYTEWQIKTLFMQEMLARGILTFGGMHFISYAHTREDVDRVLAAYDEVLPLLKDAVASGRLEKYLRCEPLVPKFRLR